MAPIVGKIESIQCGKLYGSIRTVFQDKQTEDEISHKTYQTRDINFIPLYMRRRMAEVRVERLPNKQEVKKIIAATFKPIM